MGDDYNPVIETLIRENNRNKLVENSKRAVEGHIDGFVSIMSFNVLVIPALFEKKSLPN